MGSLRTKRRVRRFVRVAIPAAALIALASIIDNIARPPASAPTVAEQPEETHETQTAGTRPSPPPAPKEADPLRTRPVESIANAKDYPGIEIAHNATDRILVISNRSPHCDRLFAENLRVPITRITQLSSFAMARYIRGHAKIEPTSKTGLAFRAPQAERAFYKEGVPVRWLATRISFLPRRSLVPRKKGEDHQFPQLR